MIKKTLSNIKKFLSFIRYGEVWRKDTFLGAEIFFKIITLLNNSEYKIRKKIGRDLCEDLSYTIKKEKGFEIFKLSKIKSYEQIKKNLDNLINNYNKVDWNYEYKINKKKYLLQKKIDLNKDTSQVTNFLLPIVSDYIGSLPVLLDVSYLYSPNDQKDFRGSQLWHLDFEDVRQLKIWFPIDHVVDNKTGSLCIIDKTNSHEIFNKCQNKNKKLLRQSKIDDKLVLECLDDPVAVITNTKINLDEVLMVDTSNCYHFGSREAVSSRKLLQFHFTSAFSTEVPIFFRKNLDLKDKSSNIYSYYKNNFNYFFANNSKTGFSFKFY